MAWHKYMLTDKAHGYELAFNRYFRLFTCTPKHYYQNLSAASVKEIGMY